VAASNRLKKPGMTTLAKNNKMTAATIPQSAPLTAFRTAADISRFSSLHRKFQPDQFPQTAGQKFV